MADKKNKKITSENNLYNGVPYSQRKPRSEMTEDELKARTAYIRAKQQENLSASDKRKIKKIRERRLNKQQYENI